MSRWDVDVWMHIRHLMAVEAPDATTAQERALQELQDHSPDELRTEIIIERASGTE